MKSWIPPDEGDIRDAIYWLKNNKALGVDGIPAELWKHRGEDVSKYIHNLILVIWVEERIPEELYV